MQIRRIIRLQVKGLSPSPSICADSPAVTVASAARMMNMVEMVKMKKMVIAQVPSRWYPRSKFSPVAAV